jgi:Cd2+/Zn2+-exporting ATPase
MAIPLFMEQTSCALSCAASAESHAVSAHEHGDWRGELLSACLCGAFGVAGALASGSTSLALFVLAYLAGGWFSAQDVWALLKIRVVDVHFLMLLVAIGQREHWWMG